VAREAHEEPQTIHDAPHASTVHKLESSAMDDPERWALTWRAWQRKRR